MKSECRSYIGHIVLLNRRNVQRSTTPRSSHISGWIRSQLPGSLTVHGQHGLGVGNLDAQLHYGLDDQSVHLIGTTFDNLLTPRITPL